MPHLFRPATGGTAAEKLDPRVVMLSAIVLLLLSLASANPVFPVFLFVVLNAVSLSVTGISPKNLALRYAHPVFLSAVVLILKLVAGGGEFSEFAAPWGRTFQFSKSGLLEGSVIGSRILASAAILILCGRLATFTGAMGALSWLRVPRTMVDVSLFAWRYIFLFHDDASTIYAAQKNRLGYTSTMRGLRSFGSMAGLLAIKAFDHSTAVTVSLAQRGYDGSMPMLARRSLSLRQISGMIAVCALSALIWFIVQ